MDAFATAVIALGYTYFLVVYLGPTSPFEHGRVQDLAWYVTFMARTFDYHIGLFFAGLTIVALVLGRFRVAAAAVPLFLIGVGPTIRSMAQRSEVSPATGNFRVITANLLWVNQRTDFIMEEILAESPDLLFLQEYTPAAELAAQRALSGTYPYAFTCPAPEAFGAAIYSKHPLSDTFRCPGFLPGDRSPFLRAVVHLSTGNITTYCVHIVPPTWSNRMLMRDQFAAIFRELKEQPGPVIVAGDFNFTSRTSMAELLESLGLSDAQVKVGHGRGGTFKIPFLPDICLDHVYLSRGFMPSECRTGVGRGSDHRPVRVDLQVVPTSP